MRVWAKQNLLGSLKLRLRERIDSERAASSRVASSIHTRPTVYHGAGDVMHAKPQGGDLWRSCGVGKPHVNSYVGHFLPGTLLEPVATATTYRAAELGCRAWSGSFIREEQHPPSSMHSHIRPHTHVALRLPSGILKIVELKPNTYVA